MPQIVLLLRNVLTGVSLSSLAFDSDILGPLTHCLQGNFSCFFVVC